MNFIELTKLSASYRQSKFDGWGSWCAKCGTALAGKKGGVTQHIPAEKGGKWDVDNCIILCSDCFEKIGNHKETLSDTEIPYYHRYPDLWHGNTDYVIKYDQTASGVEF
jgi:hypothetical protein